MIQIGTTATQEVPFITPSTTWMENNPRWNLGKRLFPLDIGVFWLNTILQYYRNPGQVQNFKIIPYKNQIK